MKLLINYPLMLLKMTKLKYKNHKISGGTKPLTGLPAVFGNEKDSSVLELTATDDVLNAEVSIIYTVFELLYAIIRSVRIKNNGTKPLYIRKALSFSLDMDDDNFDMISLHGSYHLDHPAYENNHRSLRSVLSYKALWTAVHHGMWYP